MRTSAARFDSLRSHHRRGDRARQGAGLLNRGRPVNPAAGVRIPPSPPAQNCQVELQLQQCACVTFSFRESPTARSEVPAVRIAAVALPPETPFFCVNLLTRILPFSWQ